LVGSAFAERGWKCVYETLPPLLTTAISESPAVLEPGNSCIVQDALGDSVVESVVGRITRGYRMSIPEKPLMKEKV